MNQSLSLILTVSDGETSLQRQVLELLDLLPDLTPRFEILIIDDASEDQSFEIATELSRCYPQVKLLRNHEHLGTEMSIQRGIQETQGDIVFTHESATPINMAEIVKLWEMRDDPQLLLARTRVQPRPLDDSLLTRLMNWGDALRRNQELRSNEAPTQMIRRKAVEKMGTADLSDSDLKKRIDDRTETVCYEPRKRLPATRLSNAHHVTMQDM